MIFATCLHCSCVSPCASCVGVVFLSRALRRGALRCLAEPRFSLLTSGPVLGQSPFLSLSLFLPLLSPCSSRSCSLSLSWYVHPHERVSSTPDPRTKIRCALCVRKQLARGQVKVWLACTHTLMRNDTEKLGSPCASSHTSRPTFLFFFLATLTSATRSHLPGHT